MRSNKQFYTSKGSNQVGLYSFVFISRSSLTVILFLLLSFLIQPFHLALANEVAEEDQLVLPEEVVEQLPTVGETEAMENEEVDEVEDVTGVEENVSSDIETETIEEGAVDTSANEENESESSQVDTDSSDGDTETTESTASSTDETDLPDEEIETASTTDDSSEGDSDNDTSTSTATSTDDGADDNTDTENSTSTDNGSGSGGEGGGSGSDDDDAQDETSTSTDDTSDDSGTGDSSDSGDTDNNSTTTDDLIDNDAIEEGLNDLVDGVVDEVVTLTRQLVTEENYYQFSRQSCVAVGDGTFHCTTKDSIDIDPDSDVYAEKDADGDLEIYMRTSKGEIKQLSDNDYDDASPDLDLASMRVVWQRLIDGRHQIISYDLEEREETQLTFSRTNNMEPKVAKEGVVWQAWDGNDWEILFFDGQFTDQITNNELQDVTPVVEDGYVLWNVIGGEESEARVYSIVSGEVMTITGHEGGAVANPRFVLVYDTKFDNGDIVTQGFDPVTGLAEPLAAKPTELPFDIPEPDPVGEIRALINNKSTQGEKEIIVVPDGDDVDDLNLASTSATSTDTLSLDNIDVDPDNSDELPSDVENFELEDHDLVITDQASSTESGVNDEFHLATTTPDTSSSTAVHVVE